MKSNLKCYFDWEVSKNSIKVHFWITFWTFILHKLWIPTFFWIQKFWLCSCVCCLTRSVNVTWWEKYCFKFWNPTGQKLDAQLYQWLVNMRDFFQSLNRFSAVVPFLMILDNILRDYSETFVIHRQAWSQNLRERSRMLELHTWDI